MYRFDGALFQNFEIATEVQMELLPLKLPATRQGSFQDAKADGSYFYVEIGRWTFK